MFETIDHLILSRESLFFPSENDDIRVAKYIAIKRNYFDQSRERDKTMCFAFL